MKDEERTKETITTPVISDCESETPSDKLNGLLPPKPILETITEKLTEGDDSPPVDDSPAKEKKEVEVIKSPEKLAEDDGKSSVLYFCFRIRV